MTHDAGRQWGAYAMLVAVMLFWSGNTIVARAVAPSIPPFTLAFVRWTGASLFLLPFAWRYLRTDWLVIRRSWPRILLLGLLGIGMFNSLLYSSLHYTTATNSLLLQAAIPPVVLLFDSLFFRVRPGWAHMFGVVLTGAGVASVISAGTFATFLQLTFGRGDLLMLAAVAVWALYMSLLRLQPKIDWRSFLFATFMVGVVLLVPFAASEWPQFEPSRLGAGEWLAFLYVMLLPSLFAYGMFNAAVAKVGAGTASIAITLQPLFGALLAALLLSEPIGRHHLIGMVLISGGIIIAIFFTGPARN